MDQRRVPSISIVNEDIAHGAVGERVCNCTRQAPETCSGAGVLDPDGISYIHAALSSRGSSSLR
jgi:hypothetical protein